MISTKPPYGSGAPNCSLDVIEDNLYVFTFHASSRAAADAFVANLNWVYARAVEKQTPFYCLADGSHVGAAPPITTLMRGVRNVVAKHPVRPYNRMAIVMNSSYVMLVQSFLKLVPAHNPVRFFHTKEAAMEWLRS